MSEAGWIVLALYTAWRLMRSRRRQRCELDRLGRLGLPPAEERPWTDDDYWPFDPPHKDRHHER